MKPTHIEHLGIAVTSIEEAAPFFEFLSGSKCYSTGADEPGVHDC